MVDELLAALVTAILLIAVTVRRPTSATCPRGYALLEGVRTQPLGAQPRGAFTCARPPIGGDDDALTGESTARDQPGEIRSRIYCTGGAVPILVNHRTVGCQRRPGA